MSDEQLFDEAKNFAERLNHLVAGVLGPDVAGFRAEIGPSPSAHVLVSAAPRHVRRRGDAAPFATLDVHFNCDWSSAKGFLAVRGLTFAMRTPTVKGPPVLTVDYLRDMEAVDVPVAHINVSSQHLGLQKMVDPESVGDSSPHAADKTLKLHLPTGGHRFRPSFEDVLHMLIREFDIDRQDGWRETLELHRSMYREFQTAAAVRDHPQKAAEVLGALGYRVTWEGEGDQPAIREERLQRF